MRDITSIISRRGPTEAVVIGQSLGAYTIGAKLGEGGMGEVDRARDPKLNRDVAIKVLLPAVANDPDRLARFGPDGQRFLMRVQVSGSETGVPPATVVLNWASEIRK